MELATALAALHLPSVTSVASLPVELLADVFTHVGDLRDIFSCSHTCKFWNTVTVGSKALWKDIPTWSLPLTKLFLERSDPAPIVVDIEGPAFESGRDYQEAVFLALQCLPRIEVLKLEAVNNPASVEILKLLSAQPASVLRILDISIHRGHGRIDLPSTLFGGIPPPRLERLYLQFCNTTPAFAPFHAAGLTVLHLTYCNIHETVDAVLDTLAHLPALEEVFIDGSPHIDTRLLTTTSRWTKRGALALPAVRSFRLILEIMVSSLIVSRLRLPSSVGLEMMGRTSDQAALTEMAETVAEHYARATVAPFDKVFLVAGELWDVVQGMQGPDGAMWQATDKHTPRYPAGDPYKQLAMPPGFVVRIPHPRGDLEEGNLEGFLKGLPVCTRTKHLTLFVEGPCTVRRGFWRQLKRFQYVEVLELASRAVWEMMPVVRSSLYSQPGTEGGDEDGDGDGGEELPLFTLFPNVHTVRLSAVQFLDGDWSERTVEELCDCVREFAWYWPCFREVSIERCSVTEGIVGSLKERLREHSVVWDGRCNRVEEDGSESPMEEAVAGHIVLIS